MNDWKPDHLGSPFEQLTLDLAPDDEGPVTATLVRSLPATGTDAKSAALLLSGANVLYVHGWSDYFFQTNVARFWNDLGANFYALDLRKYGRSLSPGQTPGYVDDLKVYDEDISAALAVINGGSVQATTADDPDKGPLILVGHSTGGLILTLWASRNVGVPNALILNSPWLEFQTGEASRKALSPFVKLQAKLEPKHRYPSVDFGFYQRAQEELGVAPDPEYAKWRPSRGFDTHPGWLNAIFEGQEQVRHGVYVGCPVLVLLSARSSNPAVWTQKMTHTDGVLVVDEIAKTATNIYPSVTIVRIRGAIHDVFLSSSESRSQAFKSVARWILEHRVADTL